MAELWKHADLAAVAKADADRLVRHQGMDVTRALDRLLEKAQTYQTHEARSAYAHAARNALHAIGLQGKDG